MPQREFWTERHPTEVVWRYRIDHLKPLDGATVLCTILDQEGTPIVSAGHGVPHLVTHEAVNGFLINTWDAYLFRSIASIQNAAQINAQFWMREAKARSNPDDR